MTYETLVAESFRQKSALPFSNESAVHARVIMKHILLNADKNVALYSDQLPSAVDVDSNRVEVYDWPELVDAAELYLTKSTDTKLSIKVKSLESEVPSASRKFLALQSRFPKQMTIEWGKDSKLPNFMANDQGAFRVEMKEHQAVACAHNPNVANRLLALHTTQA